MGNQKSRINLTEIKNKMEEQKKELDFRDSKMEVDTLVIALMERTLDYDDPSNERYEAAVASYRNKNEEFKVSLESVQEEEELRFSEEQVVGLTKDLAEAEEANLLKNKLLESKNTIEALRTELQESQNKLAEKSELLKEHEKANNLLKNEVLTSKNTIKALRTELRKSQNRLAEKSEDSSQANGFIGASAVIFFVSFLILRYNIR